MGSRRGDSHLGVPTPLRERGGRLGLGEASKSSSSSANGSCSSIATSKSSSLAGARPRLDLASPCASVSSSYLPCSARSAMAAVLAPRPGVRRFVGDRASPSESAGSGDLTVILPRDLCDGVGELSGESSLPLPMIGAGLPATFSRGSWASSWRSSRPSRGRERAARPTIKMRAKTREADRGDDSSTNAEPLEGRVRGDARRRRLGRSYLLRRSPSSAMCAFDRSARVRRAR